MKSNNSFIFSVTLSFLLSLTISCTKEEAKTNSVKIICDTCKHEPPLTITIEIRDSSWISEPGGRYVSNLNDLLKSSVDSIKEIYNVSINTGSGYQQVSYNGETNCYGGTISMTKSQNLHALVYNAKKVGYYGQSVYESLPFSYLDVTIEMQK